MAQLGMQVIRQLVRTGSVIAPRLTGNLMFDRFCTPPRAAQLGSGETAAAEQAKARLRDGAPGRVPYRGQGFPPGEVQYYRFACPGPDVRGTILLLHGWTGRAAFMTAFVEPLTASGFDVVACDLPAHGESGGSRLHIPLAVSALSALHRETGPWFGIIGHSFGGAIAPALIGGMVEGYPPVPIERLVLIAAPNSMPDLFRQFGQAVGLTAASQRWFEANVKRLSGRDLAGFESAAVLRRTGTPTLVLHATNDKEVPFSNALALGEAGSHVTVADMPGLGHRRILYAPATVRAAVAYLSAS